MTLQSYGRTDAHSPSEREINELAPWFHNLHLPSGQQTAPDHPLGDFPAFKWRELAPFLPDDLNGWRALDIGCNAGFYSFELAKRGARVLALEHDEHYARQARWARAAFALDEQVELAELDLYELAHTDDTFDLVLFLGVLYHLRYPLLGLDIAATKAKRVLVVQTLELPVDATPAVPADLAFEDRAALADPAWPKLAFVEHRLAGDPTNWWVPSSACVEAMIRSTGWAVSGRPGEGMYVCEPDPEGRRRANESAAAMRTAVGRENR